ncbi:MAG: hypothetical protein AAGF44_03425 [Pseudomonadota bacterium]
MQSISKAASFAALTGVLAAALPAAIPAPVQAQSQTQVRSPQMICGKRQNIIQQLERKYGETARVMGFSQGAGVVEVYANTESGSWTILVTNPSGTSCLMAAGEAFEAMDVKLGDAPA